jgi:hypothetical protein
VASSFKSAGFFAALPGRERSIIQELGGFVEKQCFNAVSAMAEAGGSVAARQPDLPLERDWLDGERDPVSPVSVHLYGPSGAILPFHCGAPL